jgi:hypothetical protein
LHSAARPLFVAGPRDNVKAIIAQLEAAVGAEGYDFVDATAEGDDEEWEEDEEKDDHVIAIEEVSGPPR